MSKSVLLTVLTLVSLVSFGQNISVTFSGTGASSQIDSVNATNLKTNQSVTLPGNETLVLSVRTGIPAVSELNDMGMVYPNPFSGRATLSMAIQSPQMVYLSVLNMVGQIVARTQALIQPGENEFALTVNTTGIYSVIVANDLGTNSYKIICTDATEADNSIQYPGASSINQNNHNNPSQPGLKSSQTSYTLGYTSGDIILYRCIGRIYTTIITDSPIDSKNYIVEFVACTDADRRSYPIIKIGTQTWMAENLAYLPTVNSSGAVSDTAKYYYVYDYEGGSVSSAKSSDNYKKYGVLYNWRALMDGAASSNSVPSGVRGPCPTGWHVPGYSEWATLIQFLGSDCGYLMKSTQDWAYGGNGTNSSGFNVFPSGAFGANPRLYRYTFMGKDNYTTFWSATQADINFIYCAILEYDWRDVKNISWAVRNSACSVRCLKD